MEGPAFLGPRMGVCYGLRVCPSFTCWNLTPQLLPGGGNLGGDSAMRAEPLGTDYERPSELPHQPPT